MFKFLKGLLIATFVISYLLVVFAAVVTLCPWVANKYYAVMDMSDDVGPADGLPLMTPPGQRDKDHPDKVKRCKNGDCNKGCKCGKNCGCTSQRKCTPTCDCNDDKDDDKPKCGCSAQQGGCKCCQNKPK